MRQSEKQFTRHGDGVKRSHKESRDIKRKSKDPFGTKDIKFTIGLITKLGHLYCKQILCSIHREHLNWFEVVVHVIVSFSNNICTFKRVTGWKAGSFWDH
jgi:hypothetical protein